MQINELRPILENAARKVQLPPGNITAEERSNCENIITEFYNSAYEIQIYIEMLENTTSYDVKFYSVIGLKNAIIRRWSSLSNENIAEALQFFTRKISALDSPGYVLNAYFGVTAMLYKRLFTLHYSLCKQFSDIYFDLFNKNELNTIQLASDLWNNILTEFKFVNKTSDVNLKIERIYSVKREFEKSELLFLLEVCIRKLAQYAQATTSETSNCKPVLDLLLQILTWKFFPHNINLNTILYEMEEDDSVEFKPPAEWKSILLSDDFFGILWTCFRNSATHNTDVAMALLSCFSRLAFLSGSVFNDKSEMVRYLEKFLTFTVSSCSLDSLDIRLLIELTNIFDNLAIRSAPIHEIDATIADRYFMFLIQLSGLLFRSTHENNNAEACDNAEEDVLNAATQLMSATMKISIYTEFLRSENFRLLVLSLIKNYIDFRFPEYSGDANDSLNNTIYSMECEDDDRICFEDDLSYFGLLGQLFPFESLSALLNLIYDRLKSYSNMLSLAGKGKESLSITPFHQLAEDLHWVLLLSAHILTEDSADEYSSIPQSIMSLSVSMNKKSDGYERFILNSYKMDLDSIMSADIDIVIKFISFVFNLIYIQEKAVRSNLYNVLSPQLATTVLWFLHRFVLNYFAFKGEFAIVSNVFNYLFGASSTCLLDFVDLILHKIILNMEIWAAEDTVVREAVNLLDRACSNTSLCNVICKSKLFWDVGEMIACDSNVFTQLNIDHKAAFVKNFSAICFHSTNDMIKVKYSDRLIAPLAHKLESINSIEKQTSLVYSEEERKKVIYTIVIMTSIYDGCGDTDFINQFNVTSVVSKGITGILIRYNAFPEAVFTILDLFNAVVKSCCYYMKQEEYRQVCQVFAHLLDAVVAYDICHFKFSRIDDDCVKIYAVIFSIMNSILSKEFLDLSISAPNEADSIEKIIEEISLHSLTVILPLFSMELLCCSEVYNAYFSYLDSLTQNHQSVIFRLHHQLFIFLMDTVAFGFDHLGSCVISYAVRVLTHLCCFSAENGSKVSQTHMQKLESFTSHVLQQLFTSNRLVDSVESFADALFMLLRLFRTHIESQMNAIVVPLIHDEDQAVMREKLLSVLEFSNREFVRVNRRNFIELVHSLIFQIHCSKKILL